MALEMQFLPGMKSVVGAVLSVVFIGGGLIGPRAEAQGSTCVNSFKKAKSEFLRVYAELEQTKGDREALSIIVGAIGVRCMVAVPTVMGKVGCGVGSLLVGGPPYGHSVMLGRRMQRLYDGYRLYQVYSAYRFKTDTKSESVQEFFAELGVDIQKEETALRELATLMEGGSLCEGQQTRSYNETLNMMKGRLYAP